MKLPFSWLEKDGIKAMKKYVGKWATDAAWHQEVATKPDIARAVGLEKDPWGRPLSSKQKSLKSDENVQVMLKDLAHSSDFGNWGMNTLGHIVNNTVMGTVTGFVNTIQAIPVAFAGVRNPLQAARIAASILHIKRNFQHMYDTGSMESGMNPSADLWKASAKIGDRTKALSNFYGKYFGQRVIGMMAERLVLHGAGEAEAILIKKTLATADPASRAYKQAARNNRAINPLGKDLSIEEMGARLAERNSGHFDSTDVPTLLLKNGPLSFAWKLLRWGNIRARFVERHVVTSLVRDGDVIPLMNYMVGTTIAGLAANEIKDKIRIIRDRMPNIKELRMAGSKNIRNYAYNISKISAAGGQFGIYSDIAKSLSDISVMNPDTIGENPLQSMVKNTVDNVAQYAGGLQDATGLEEHSALLAKLVTSLALGENQAGRVAKKILTKNDPEIERQNAVRNQEAWEIAAGLKDPTATTPGNRYGKQFAGDFKKATNPEDIKNSFIKAFQEIKNRSRTPEELQRRYNALGTMSPPGVPAKDPEYSKYLMFRQAIVGREQMLKEAKDAEIRKAFNEAKSSMVGRID